MTVAVKICGLTTAETVKSAARAGADWIGFVLHPASPRFVTPEQARILFDTADDAQCQSVALIVNEPDAVIDTTLTKMTPHWLQLHGDETPERVRAVKARFGVPIIKAVGVSDQQDLVLAQSYEGSADRLLLDAKPPKGAAQKGGHGTAFDWGLLEGLTLKTPWLLAGGLSPETVAGAIAATGAHGVDVSSGVEAARGVKSVRRIEAFMAGVRDAAKPARAAL